MTARDAASSRIITVASGKGGGWKDLGFHHTLPPVCQQGKTGAVV